MAIEIVEYFNLAADNVHFIENLIDSLFLHLVPGWKIASSFNHTINACKDVEGSSQFFTDGWNSVGSLHCSSEATISLDRQLCPDSTNECIQVIHDDTALVQAESNILGTSATSLSCAASDGLNSDSSFCSTFPSLENGGKSFEATGAFLGYHTNFSDCNGCEMPNDMNVMLSNSKISLHLNQRDRDLGIQTISDASTFSDIFSNDSSTCVDKVEVNKNEVDEELLIELDVLELHFQSVIDYISHKRQEAIAAAKKRATDRKQPLVGR